MKLVISNLQNDILLKSECHNSCIMFPYRKGASIGWPTIVTNGFGKKLGQELTSELLCYGIQISIFTNKFHTVLPLGFVFIWGHVYEQLHGKRKAGV